MFRLIILLLAFAAIAACSSHVAATGNAADSAAPASAATNVLAGTPMAAYGHALNRAKNVQNVVNDQAKKQAKAIDDATGGH